MKGPSLGNHQPRESEAQPLAPSLPNREPQREEFWHSPTVHLEPAILVLMSASKVEVEYA